MAQLKLIFLALLFYQQELKVQCTPMKRIINGSQAVAKQFPYQVFLEVFTDIFSSRCGGAIISSRSILTAAHCVDFNIKAVNIYLGAVDILNTEELGQQRLTVHQNNILMHPGYIPEIGLNDIALIRLSKEITFDDYIQSIKLPDPSVSYDNQMVFASGWGRTESGKGSNHLLYFNETILSNDECRPLHQKYNTGYIFTSSLICLAPSESCTCHGDSGGPLSIRSDDGTNTLVGILSYGVDENCTIYRPDIYTRVSSYLEWIKLYD